VSSVKWKCCPIKKKSGNEKQITAALMLMWTQNYQTRTGRKEVIEESKSDKEITALP